MVESELEQNLKKGVISQKEYDYLIQNRTSALPSYYKSFPFIAFLIAVPILQKIFIITVGFLCLKQDILSIGSLYLIQNILSILILFLIYKFSKRSYCKMGAWVWFIIMLASTLGNFRYIF